MAEAEDVIQDLARHATVFARDLWLRHHRPSASNGVLTLKEVARRLDALLTGAFGLTLPIRIASPPAPATWLSKVFQRADAPRSDAALPATDGSAIWLPASLQDTPAMPALARYRLAALRQAMRVVRGTPLVASTLTEASARDFFLVQEAHACDVLLVRMLPGTMTMLQRLRQECLAQRPPLKAFAAGRRPLEEMLRQRLAQDLCEKASVPTPQEIADKARHWGAGQTAASGRLFADEWTGELRSPATGLCAVSMDDAPPESDHERKQVRSAKLTRSPQVRPGDEEEDDTRQGAWMVQTAQPQEKAEDPMGLQRPTDQDASTAAEELADALSELPEARLVRRATQAKEVLLSEEPPEHLARTTALTSTTGPSKQCLRYPEWDHRSQTYIEDGVCVHVGICPEGPQAWVTQTLQAHHAMLTQVRRRFEMLKAQRVRLRKQLDGDELDLDACVESRADFRAGLPLAQALYQQDRPLRRDMAVLILTDISGSTDSWISRHQRVIDVERVALLLVSVALQSMGQRHALMAFSGEGPNRVDVRHIKGFKEPFSDVIGRRIASLEPEHYTRAGAALRHATATLMAEPARHRLLLLISDGKPNDVDAYEGPYGVEDLRQAVTEATLQGIQPFCLTVDAQGPSYLPGVFGRHRYGLLNRPEMLPSVLLDWMRRLVQTA